MNDESVFLLGPMPPRCLDKNSSERLLSGTSSSAPPPPPPRDVCVVVRVVLSLRNESLNCDGVRGVYVVCAVLVVDV